MMHFENNIEEFAELMGYDSVEEMVEDDYDEDWGYWVLYNDDEDCLVDWSDHRVDKVLSRYFDDFEEEMEAAYIIRDANSDKYIDEINQKIHNLKYSTLK